MKPFDLMLVESNKRGIPRSFATDLTRHDFESLGYQLRQTGRVTPFLWCLYATGTHMIWAHEPRQHIGTILKCLVDDDTFDAESVWFQWDGRELTELKTKTIEALLEAFDNLCSLNQGAVP